MSEPERGSRWPMTMLDLVASYLAVHGAFNLTAATPWSTTLRLFGALAVIAAAVAAVGHVLTRRSQR